VIVYVSNAGARPEKQVTYDPGTADIRVLVMDVCDPDNRFLIVPSQFGDRVLSFRFDAATGVITPNTPEAVHSPPGSHPRHMQFHPTGRYAYVLHEHDGALCVYAYSTTSGVLSEIQRV
jgi:6-phosphogluconolactonase